MQPRDILYRLIRMQLCNRIRPGERTPKSCQMSYGFHVGIVGQESQSPEIFERDIKQLEDEFNAWGGLQKVATYMEENYAFPSTAFPMYTRLKPNESVHIDSLPLHSVAFLACVCSSSEYLDLLMGNDIACDVILSFILAVTDKSRRGKPFIFSSYCIFRSRKDFLSIRIYYSLCDLNFK